MEVKHRNLENEGWHKIDEVPVYEKDGNQIVDIGRYHLPVSKLKELVSKVEDLKGKGIIVRTLGPNEISKSGVLGYSTRKLGVPEYKSFGRISRSVEEDLWDEKNGVYESYVPVKEAKTDSVRRKINILREHLKTELERIDSRYTEEKTRRRLKSSMAFDIICNIMSLDYKEIPIRELDDLLEPLDTSFLESYMLYEKEMSRSVY